LGTRVALESADGQMFLQSAHTGFLEAAPGTVEATPPPVARAAAGGGRERAEPGDRGVAMAAHRRPVPPPSPPGRADRPSLTIRPLAPPPPIPVPAGEATTLGEALSAAYETNPNINKARANVRAADEGIAVAKSGNRPTVTAAVSTGVNYQRDVNVPLALEGSGNFSSTETPTALSVDLTQPLFQGFQVRNRTRQAESVVLAERAQLDATEQNVLFNTALAFLDVRRFRAGVRLREQEVTFLGQQVEAARARLRFGEGTQTDIDQAETRLAESEALLADERAAADAADARFIELTGLAPADLGREFNVVPLLPRTLAEAITLAQQANPAIGAAIHQADASTFEVKALEGQALPQVSLTGRLRTDIDVDERDRVEAAEVRLNVEVPIYQGGRVSAQVRQAKEELGGARIGVDVARDEVRADVATAWTDYRGAIAAIEAADQSIAAARRALEGVLEELRVGQRTTLDVLDAQRDLIRAQLTRLASLRERDASAFAILRGIGALTPDILNLPVVPYVPEEHYVAVNDRWAGMRTPDGS
jgi:outer membrane protein